MFPCAYEIKFQRLGGDFAIRFAAITCLFEDNCRNEPLTQDSVYVTFL